MFIPLKEMWLKVHHLQARRIRCEFCEGAFTCLVEGDFKVSTTGLPLVNSDEGMREALWGATRKRLQSVDRKAHRETGLCPHCRRYQTWMIRRSWWTGFPRLGCGIPAGFFLVFGFFTLLMNPPAALRSFGLASVPLAIGVVIAWRRSLPSGIQRRREDPSAITDDDVRGLLRHAREVQREPLQEWYLSMHEKPPADRLLFSLGCRDLTGEDFFPCSVTTDSVLAEP